MAHHLKALKLPTFPREYAKLAAACAKDRADHPKFLLRLAELELLDRERRLVARGSMPRWRLDWRPASAASRSG